MNKLQQLRENTEALTVPIDRLITDPEMQMRVEVDQGLIVTYSDQIGQILKQRPIEVAAVGDGDDECLYIVDGFHRYLAARAADLKIIPIITYKTTRAQAIQIAMASNYDNGARPSKADTKKSITKLLETAPDFGYRSTSVREFLESFGIARTTSNPHTKELRASIDTKRDAKVLELHDEGQTQSEIAKVIGCDQKTIGNIIKKLKENGRNYEVPKDVDVTETKVQALEESHAFNLALHKLSGETVKDHGEWILETLINLLMEVQKSPDQFLEDEVMYLHEKLSRGIAAIETERSKQKEDI